ncbi:hypothetical protein ACFFRR_011196 [Megaselia abdita]
MTDLSGKNVVYVAGLGGIGLASCKSFLKRRIQNLIIVDVVERPQIIKDLQSGFPETKISFMSLDVSKKPEIETCLRKIIQKIEFIDILVNGAGIVADQNVELSIAVNLTGLINTTLLAIPLMDKSRQGRGGIIVNMASILSFEPFGGLAVYTATKHGVLGFTRSISDDIYYKRTGIACIAVCPGITDTPMIGYEGKCTFDYSLDMCQGFINAKNRQTAEEMGESLVKVVETWKNGSVWLCDEGKIKELEMPKNWELRL